VRLPASPTAFAVVPFRTARAVAYGPGMWASCSSTPRHPRPCRNGRPRDPATAARRGPGGDRTRRGAAGRGPAAARAAVFCVSPKMSARPRALPTRADEVRRLRRVRAWSAGRCADRLRTANPEQATSGQAAEENRCVGDGCGQLTDLLLVMVRTCVLSSSTWSTNSRALNTCRRCRARPTTGWSAAARRGVLGGCGRSSRAGRRMGPSALVRPGRRGLVSGGRAGTPGRCRDPDRRTGAAAGVGLHDRVQLASTSRWLQISRPQSRVSAAARPAAVRHRQRAPESVLGARRVVQANLCSAAAPIRCAGFPGLGHITVATMLAEMGEDHARFSTADVLLAETGTAPVTRSSGRRHTVRFRYAANNNACVTPSTGGMAVVGR
jgi:Transposase IS116/IS110/IS902 family